MGILDDAEVSGNEIPKDPFGFGNDYWPISLLAFNRPKLAEGQDPQIAIDRPFADISSSGKQYGGMAVFRCLDERYQYLGKNNPNQMPGQLGFGQWFALPSPKWAREQVPFDKNSQEGKQLIFNWTRLCFGMGIPIDQIGSADIPDIIGKTCLAKVRVTQDENDFWVYRVGAFKPMPKEGSPQGIGEFTKPGMSNGNATSAMSEMERAMMEEQNNA